VTTVKGIEFVGIDPDPDVIHPPQKWDPSGYGHPARYDGWCAACGRWFPPGTRLIRLGDAWPVVSGCAEDR
jgi:hypothetical protein